MPPPSLNLHIPFVLLGLHSLPDYIYTPAEHHIKPLRVVYEVLARQHPDIPIQLWIPGEAENGGAQQSTSPRAERSRWRAMTSAGGWLLRCGTAFHEPDVAVESDARDVVRLSDAEASALDPEAAWWYPVVLAYRAAPLSNVQGVLRQMQTLLATVRTRLDNGATGPFGVAVTGACRLRIDVVLHPEERTQRAPSGLEACASGSQVVGKVVLALAGWEREFALAKSMDGVSACWTLSRFLEHEARRRMRGERRQAWREGGEDGVREWVGCMERQAELGFGTGHGVGRNEVWRVVDEVIGVWEDGDGGHGRRKGGRRVDEDQVATFVRDMRGFERRKKVGFEVGFPALPEQDDERREVDEMEEEEEMVWRSFRGTMDPWEISAYVDVVSCLIDLCTTTSYAVLREKVERFRELATDREEDVRTSFWRLMTLLRVDGATCEYFKDALSGDQGKEEHRVHGEFADIVSLVEGKRKREREYVPEFVRRYEEAGGFLVRKRRKLYALLLEEDKRRNVSDAGGVNRFAGLEDAGYVERGEWATVSS